MVFAEEAIQKILRYSVLSPSSVKYIMENLNVFNWESDSLLITKSDLVYEFEIKISKSDFKKDFKHKVKKHQILETKQNENKPNYFYYVVPENLISVDEVPDYAGLIYIIDRCWQPAQIIKAAPKLHKSKIDYAEKRMLDKFYYNYRHWKLKAETNKELLEETKNVDGHCYKYTISEAHELIETQKDKIKNLQDKVEHKEKIIVNNSQVIELLKSLLIERGLDYSEIRKKISELQ